MPLYEFSCKKCGANFELLSRADDQMPECPECKSSETEKKVSSINSVLQKGKNFFNQCNANFS